MMDEASLFKRPAVIIVKSIGIWNEGGIAEA